MSPITTHVLDTSCGRPAAAVHVTLEREHVQKWARVASGTTDADGRLRTLLDPDTPLTPGIYRLIFDTSDYFAAQHVTTFFPRVTIEFIAAAGEAHYHVPLLISPFGYSTYRGT